MTEEVWADPKEERLEDCSKVDLKNACTYVIPLRIESADRMRNVITTLTYLLKNFNARVIVKEFDKESIFNSSVRPQLETVLYKQEYENLDHIFEQTDDFIFHRTRLINDMVEMVDTPIVCNHDCDIILPYDSHFLACKYLVEGYLPPNASEDTVPEPVKVVYPYGYGMFQYQVKANDNLVSDFINTNFNFKTFEGHMRKWDAKFGFCQFFNTEEYKRLGMENEKFISYGYEDDERYHRFNTCSNVIRLNNDIFHLEHSRTQNSWFTNPHIEDNRKEWEKMQYWDRNKLEAYYENIDYMKKRRGQK